MVFFDEGMPFFSGGAKQFFLSLFNESKEMGVVNNAGRVRVGPIGLESSFEHQGILAPHRGKNGRPLTKRNSNETRWYAVSHEGRISEVTSV